VGSFAPFWRAFAIFAIFGGRFLILLDCRNSRRNINFRHVTFVMLYFFAKQLPTHISRQINRNQQRTAKTAGHTCPCLPWNGLWKVGWKMGGEVGGRSGGRESGAAGCSIDVHKWIRALEKGRAGLKLWKVSVLLNESHLSRSGVALKYSDAWHGAIMNAS